MKATRDWGWWLRLRAGSLLNGTSIALERALMLTDTDCSAILAGPCASLTLPGVSDGISRCE